ncbi:MAG: hypothetical protein EBR55_11245, partial [Chitinophagia bacterium]|nr:hypothetical protein [Chitinophagia bacterium]
MIFYNGKQFLKSIPFFNSINSQIKDVLILIESRLNKIRFTNKIKNLNIENAFDNKSIASFLHEKMKNDSVRLIPHAKQPLHIYFVGTYYDHEAHGFIQGLKQIGEITIYENADGKYGINSSSRDAEPAFVKANNNYFLQNVIETHAKKHIDFIIGTFTAPTILIETLVEIRKIGIPVVNYAMDDRLPVHWRKYKGKRRGAFGLADAVDLTLQTTKEFVPRYLA